MTLAMEKTLRNLANPLDANVGSLKNKNSCGFDDKDFLRDGKSGLRNFAKKDITDLFTGPTLAYDNDGKLIECEMSLPSAFYSRGGHDDYAHPSFELSGSEDANMNHITNRSMTVSGPLGSERSVGSESENDKDNTIFLGTCAAEDLDIVENAILRLFQEDVQLSSKEHREDSTKLKDALGLVEHLEGSKRSVHSGAGTVDLELLSKLLDQVQSLRDQKHKHRQIGRAAMSLSQSGTSVWDITKRNSGKEKRLSKDDLKKAVEAATQAAKSASEAAKSIATLVTKNIEAMNKLVQSLNPSSSKSNPKKKERGKHQHSSSSSSSNSCSNSEESSKAIAKKIVLQNHYTHVVLGIMLVSSFVWKYIVVKVTKRVQSKVSNPWGYVGGILSDGFNGIEKEREKEKIGEREATQENSNGLSLPQLTMPQLLQKDHQTTGIETPTPLDGNGEENILNIGSNLQIKSNSNNP